ncbi:hypothetical protein ACG0Z6_08470 [Roseateles sp. BYS180W]|uniref:Uncharacterized protein n=1 Tax=Roseateles rivi TaxID=3299028 RepID=A0ABW7FVF7_9BURK
MKTSASITAKTSLLGLALISLTPAVAVAETSPYYLGASLGAYRSTNVFRESNTSGSDTIVVASLLAGLDQRLGRQRLYGDTSVSTNRYSSNSLLNNLGYSLKGGLDWETAGKLSGTLYADAQRNLADYNTGTNIQIRSKNLEENRQFGLRVRYGLEGPYSIEGDANSRARRYSAKEYDPLEYDQTAYSLGLYYTPSPIWRFGVSARLTDGSFFNGPSPYDYKRRDIDFSTNWVPSGASSLDLRISPTRETRSSGAGSSFSGLTGALAWTWRPTGKLGFQTRVARDTGSQTYYAGIPSASSALSNNVGTSLASQLSYQLTGKVSLDANVSYTTTSSTLDTPFGRIDGDDRYTGWGFGVRWEVVRWLSAGCTYSQSKRNSNVTAYSYTAGTYGCYAQGMLR